MSCCVICDNEIDGKIHLFRQAEDGTDVNFELTICKACFQRTMPKWLEMGWMILPKLNQEALNG